MTILKRRWTLTVWPPTGGTPPGNDGGDEKGKCVHSKIDWTFPQMFLVFYKICPSFNQTQFDGQEGSYS